MMGKRGREVSGRWGGREVESFQFGAQTSQSIVSQTLEWGQDEDWALKTEGFWARKTSSWTLYPTGEEEKDLVFLCVWEIPAGERGDVGVVAMCNNQIPLLMFDNWIFLKFYFIFKLYIIVLVLPNIKMNPPQVYMCSPSCTLLPPPSPYHPSGSSQCTSPKHKPHQFLFLFWPTFG